VRVLVFGAGATGTLFGARLAEAHHRVFLVGRRETVAAVRQHGIRVEGRAPVTVPCEAGETVPRDAPFDLGLLTVKTFDLAEAASALGRSTSPLPLLLPQNGLAIEGVVDAALGSAGWPRPAAHRVRAVHSVPATSLRPGVVRATGEGDVVLPAPVAPPAPDDPVGRFASLLRSGGFSVRLVPSIDREVWRKAIVNATINPVTALHGVVNGRVADEPYRTEAEALLLEALAVARNVGFPFDRAEVEADLARVVRATAENRSSMLQDLDRGRPTEIDAISGEILRQGRAHGLELPATRAVVDRVRAAAARRRPSAQPS